MYFVKYIYTNSYIICIIVLVKSDFSLIYTFGTRYRRPVKDLYSI